MKKKWKNGMSKCTDDSWTEKTVCGIEEFSLEVESFSICSNLGSLA